MKPRKKLFDRPLDIKQDLIEFHLYGFLES